MADIPEEVLLYIFRYTDIKSICNAKITCKYLSSWLNERDLYKSANLYINKIFDPCKPIVRQIKRCFERRYGDFEMKHIGIKPYGSKYIFWNLILNEPLRMWSPYMKGNSFTMSRNKYILEWASNRTSITQFEHIFRHYLPHVMTLHIKDCRSVRPYSVTISNRGTYLRSSANRFGNSFSLLPSKRKYNIKGNFNNVKQNHIPTIYYSNTQRFVRRSYHALQCMKISNKDSVKALVKWDCFPHREGFGLWVLKCSFEKVKVYKDVYAR